jgi:hypothetical protein
MKNTTANKYESKLVKMYTLSDCRGERETVEENDEKEREEEKIYDNSEIQIKIHNCQNTESMFVLP